MNGVDASSSSPASAFYAQAGAVTRMARWGLGASQRFWPALAVRAATRLFCTPLPPRRLQRHQWPQAGWRRVHWPFKDGSLVVYTPEAGDAQAPAVLLAHGWGGHAGQMLPLAARLAAAGMAPVLLDLPAHGRSAGRTSNLPQFGRAIGYAAARLEAERDAAPRAVVAHSLGANAAAWAAARGLPAGRLVLLAPPASPRDYTRYFAQAFALSERTRAGLQDVVEGREGVLMSQFEPRAVGPRIAQPTLVVHDRDDRVNAFADGLAFASAIAGARMHETRGLGHRRMLRDGPVLEAVARFVAAA